MEKYIKIAFAFVVAVLFSGCETMHQATKKTGEYVGQGANVVGGVSEGVTQGYAGANSSQENPYGR